MAEGVVLLADDDDVARYVTVTMLTRAGYEVTEVADGFEALDAVEKTDFDIVILDVKMPRLDGFEACRRLKAHEATRHLPVLMLSATFLETQDRVEGLEGGADGYLTRPVEAPVLVATVRSLLRSRRLEAAVHAAARQWTITFDSIDDAVAVVDEDLAIERANSPFGALAATTPQRLGGRSVAEVLPALAEALHPIAERDAPIELELGDRILRGRVNTLPSGDGGATDRWVVSLTDVTAARLAERGRAEELARERTISRTLQQSLVPPRLPGNARVEVRAWHQAAEELVVGGDWYDAIETDSGLWLVLGDVAGHGVAAAAQANQLRHSLRVYAHEDYDLAGAVQALNELVLNSGLTTFATVCLVAIDASGRELRIVSAGHPPPLLLRADGSARALAEGRGVALGVPHGSYEPAHLPLTVGDRLVLYTDGLVELPGELIDDGIARLLAAVAGTAGLEDAQTAVYENVVAGQTLRDDVALLLAQVRG